MRRFILVLPLLAILPAFAQSAKEEMVPMRDGVHLATSDLFAGRRRPWPVVLTRTPYGKDVMYGPSTHKDYLKHGYVRVVQDVRGKFKAEGKYAAFVDDMEDGYDTVEWIAKQPWSNGKVGMVGPSAMGIAHDLAAMAAPPHLVTASSSRHRLAFPLFDLSGRRVPENLNEEWLRMRRAFRRPMFRARLFATMTTTRAEARHARAVSRQDQHPDVQRRRLVRHFPARQHRQLRRPAVSTAVRRPAGNQKLMMGAFGHGALIGRPEISRRSRQSQRRRSHPLVRLLDEGHRQRHHEGARSPLFHDGRHHR